MSWNSRKNNKFTNIILVIICIVLAVILGSLLLTNRKEVKQESERLENLSQKQETGIEDYEAVKEHASELKEEADEEVNKILMQVAGVRLDGMSLVPVGTVGSPEESTEDLDLEQLLRQMYRVSKQTQHSFSLNSFTSFFFRFSSLSFIFLITFGK